jgi:glycosyltransferase involved in cell wall biosynthesis
VRVTVVAASSANPMGQQVFEQALREELRNKSGVTVRWLTVGALRDTTPGVRRLPMRLASSPARGWLGRLGYGPTDVVHRLDLRLPPPGRREVLTVHDCAPWRFADEGAVPPHAAGDVMTAGIVTAPSTFAAQEVTQVLGRTDVVVVPNGVDPALLSLQPDARAADRYGLPARFVLHAGGASTRKNLPALAAAWRAVRAQAPDTVLALCGAPDSRRDAAFAAVPGVRPLGRVPRTDLLALMATATAVVVPSLYEGFGLPVLEAMAVGTPVVAASCGALPEVAGDAAVLVAATPDGLADGLLRLLADEHHRATLIERGRARAGAHPWSATAHRYVELYRQVAA